VSVDLIHDMPGIPCVPGDWAPAIAGDLAVGVRNLVPVLAWMDGYYCPSDIEMVRGDGRFPDCLTQTTYMP
jgi:hypothetical protein